MAKTKNERSNRHNLYLTVTDVERKPVARNIQSTQVPPSDVLPHPDEDKWTSLPSHGQTRAKFFWLYDPFVEDAFVEPDMFQIQVSSIQPPLRDVVVWLCEAKHVMDRSKYGDGERIATRHIKLIRKLERNWKSVYDDSKRILHPNLNYLVNYPHFSGMRWPEARFTDASFTQCFLTNVRLEESFFDRSRFTLCSMSGAYMARSTLERTYFSLTRLSETTFAESKLSRTSFHDCDMEEVYFNGAQLGKGVEFVNCDLRYSSFTGVNVAGCDFSTCRFADYDSKGEVPSEFSKATGVELAIFPNSQVTREQLDKQQSVLKDGSRLMVLSGDVL